MEWQDGAILLSLQPYGERDAVARVLTPEQGRHAGLVRGARGGARLGGALQPGMAVAARWRARDADNLGTLTLEPEDHGPALLMDRPLALTAWESALAVADTALAEREPAWASYAGLKAWLDQVRTDPATPERWGAAYVAWERGLLAATGFALSLGRCAATGLTNDELAAQAPADRLAYVSPRTGRAVSANAGAPYRDRLLPLPAFLVDSDRADLGDVVDGLRLTGYFLQRSIYNLQDKFLPAARQRLAERLASFAEPAAGAAAASSTTSAPDAAGAHR